MLHGDGRWARMGAAEQGVLIACVAALALLLASGLLRILQDLLARGWRPWLRASFPLTLDAWWLPVLVILIATVSSWMLVR